MKVYVSLMILFLSNVVFAEPEINTEYKYYQIYPSSKMELGKEMNRKTPNREYGGTFQGLTRWYVTSKFPMEKVDGICKIIKVNVSLDVTFSLPEIPKTHAVNQSVRISFNRFYEALMKHEQNHMNSRLYAARDIENTLLNLEQFKSCEQLQESVKVAWSKILKKYNLRDKEYDKKTKHGRLEGVYIENFI